MSDEANPYLVYPERETDRRPRYYDGEFLRSADFIDAQRYAIDRHRRHLHGMVSPGVVSGFEVTGGTDALTVSPGTAVDASGRQIVLVGTEEKAVAAAWRGQNLALTVAYQELASDEAQGDQGSAGYTRFHEMPLLSLMSAADALPSGALLLATVQVDANGGVTVDTRARPRAGLRLPGATPALLTSDDADPGRLTLGAALRMGVPAGTAHSEATPALRVDGHAMVTGALIVGQDHIAGTGFDASADDLVVAGRISAKAGSAIASLGVGYDPPSQGDGTLTARRAAIGRGDVAAGYVTHIEGKTKTSDGIDVGGSVTVAGSLGVTGAATIGAGLGVTGSTSISQNLSAGGTLTATGKATLGNGLALTGNATMSGSLTVDAMATVRGVLLVENRSDATSRLDVGTTLTTGSDATLGRDLTVTRNVTAGGTLTTTGRADVSALGVSGAITAGSSGTFGGDLTVGGRTLSLGDGVAGQEDNAGKIKYAVHGDALELFGAGTNSTNTRKIKLYAEAGTTTTGALTIGGATTSAGKLTVSASGMEVVGNSVIRNGGLVVGQDGTAGYGGITQDGNDLVCNGQFAAGGSGGSAMYSLAIGSNSQGNKEGYLFVANRIGVVTTSPGRNLDVTGTARFTGNTEVGGTLDITGNTTIGGQLVLNGCSIAFPQDKWGGSGDWAGLTYSQVSNEDTWLELAVANDQNDILVLKQYSVDVVTLREGRLGVRTSNPSEVLHVSGRIRVNDDYAMVSPGDNVRVCWGLFDARANKLSGRGLSAVRTSKGVYKITFDTAFTSRPACFAQQYGSGNCKDGALVDSMFTTYCEVNCGDNDGDRSDRPFCIMAIGEV